MHKLLFYFYNYFLHKPEITHYFLLKKYAKIVRYEVGDFPLVIM